MRRGYKGEAPPHRALPWRQRHTDTNPSSSPPGASASQHKGNTCASLEASCSVLIFVLFIYCFLCGAFLRDAQEKHLNCVYTLKKQKKERAEQEQLLEDQCRKAEAELRMKESELERLKEIERAARAPASWKGMLGFFPDHTAVNPFQKALYSSLQEANIEVMTKEQLWNLTTETPRHSQCPVMDSYPTREDKPREKVTFIFHIHWVSLICGHRTERDALDKYKSVVQFLDRLEERRWLIVWTLHHVVDPSCNSSHSLKKLHIDLMREVASRVDVIHIMCREAIKESLYPLPRHKLAVIPHGSYVGFFNDAQLSQESARRTLSSKTMFISDMDSTVLLFLGSMGVEKDFEGLVNAFNSLSTDDMYIGTNMTQLWIIGHRLTNSSSLEALEQAIAQNSQIRYKRHWVHEDDMQFYYKAADAVVLPFVEGPVLSSGSLMTALTFGRPVIAPSTGCLRGILSPDLSITYGEDPSNNFRYLA